MGFPLGLQKNSPLLGATLVMLALGLNIVVGIIGGLLGGWLLSVFGVDVAGGGLFFSFLTCLLGAVILLWIINMVTSKRR